MGQAPGHKFGQIIGNMLEHAVRPLLEVVAKKHLLYLDWKHPRGARKGKRKVTWTDHLGNSHDLDYVLEAGGSEEAIGRPKAFIEIAYRRYTKHSRNKVGEIQCAISPLADTYREDHPFLGVILAGEFTDASIAQLRSHGFSVLYFPFDSLVTAFKIVGIDAYFDEETDDRKVSSKIKKYLSLSVKRQAKIADEVRSLHRREIKSFMDHLETTLGRRIERVFVIALHGARCEVVTVDEAVKYVEEYDEAGMMDEFVRYEVTVCYSNGDEVRGAFKAKIEAVRFLRNVM